MKSADLLKFSSVLMLLLHSSVVSAVVIGQADTFEDGTTQGWQVGLLGAPHPAPPVNVSDGGPLGAGDNYLRLTSVGGAGPGNRLAAINFAAQWAGDYATTGVTTISMDLKNFGSTELFIRLYLENPTAGPPTDQAITTALVLPSGGNWTHVEFAVDAASLIELAGDVSALLANVTALRIFHGPANAFPGPAVVAVLGVDNITASRAQTVPEPSALGLAMLGFVALLASRRNRAQGLPKA
ncbi:MAG TPA: PEP-CTERM sorting domain-containing protein [Burkholderiaceae bacterium]|nr:PEP-CTERM sorting domain-containing protein [Burkholderiaceae bacterium]